MNINKSTMGDVLDLAEERVILADDDSEVSNSFFETRCHGFKILVIVPKAGDEINVAGAMILNLIKARAVVFVAFTNFSKDTKITSEVESSLAILGVKGKNIIYLDNDDTFTLKKLILEIEADVIFCADFDIPADHRRLSINFDQALGEILSSDGNKYQPEIYKSFAYATAFSAIQDFYNDNLLETKRPLDFDLIDKVNYTWSERIRFPVFEDCRQPLIRTNPIAKAIFAYKSQRNERPVLGILNSDEVFFERRTDNLIYTAEISATSGDFSKVRDFHIINTVDFNESRANFCNHIWKPDKDDNEKRLTLSWKNLQQIEQIKIYGDIDSECETQIKISLDDNIASELNLPKYGKPCVVDFSEKVFASKIEIQLQNEIGIAEIEIFSENEPRRVIKPFIKITIDDNFVYDYLISKSKKRVELDIYRFHTTQPIEMSVSDGVIFCSDEKFILQFDSDDVTVRAEIAGDSEIFDQIKIHRKSPLHFWKLKLKQLFERINIHLYQIVGHSINRIKSLVHFKL